MMSGTRPSEGLNARGVAKYYSDFVAIKGYRVGPLLSTTGWTGESTNEFSSGL